LISEEYRLYIDKPAVCLVDKLPEPAPEMAQGRPQATNRISQISADAKLGIASI
jgi:hypothetical protein